MKKALVLILLLGGLVVSCNNKSSVSETTEAEPVAEVEVEYISEVDSTLLVGLTQEQQDKIEAVRQMFVGVANFKADSAAIQQILNTEMDSIVKFKEWYIEREQNRVKE